MATQTKAAAGTDWSVDTIRYDPLSDSRGSPETIYSQSSYASRPDAAIGARGNAIVAWQPTDPADGVQRVASASFCDANLAARSLNRVVAFLRLPAAWSGR